ncbi:MAG: sigma 54-interacting transcriptional regulator [Planctomycetes bacterium]|nr:sigma 54-interacting transcriptional regulator [Planctomycetota bacterium]
MTLPGLPARFQIERALGDGPRAPWLVLDRETQARRVLRRLEPTARAGAQLLIGVRHPRLAGVVELLVTEAGVFTVTEYASGEPYAAIHGGLTRVRRLDVVFDVLAALEALHVRGLAHGDVSPSNVVVGDDGVARLIDPIVPGDAAAPLGTLQMLAHERLLGAPPSPTADVFAIGALAYEIATGSAAFPGESAIEVVRALEAGPPNLPRSEPLATFVAAALAREPAHRPRDATEARVLLARALGRPVDAAESIAIDAVSALDLARPEPSALLRDRLFKFLDDTNGAPLVVAGGDGSGKSAALGALVDLAHARGQPAVLVRGDDPAAVLDARTRLQHAQAALGPRNAAGVVVCVDDFDRCGGDVRAFVAELARAPSRPHLAVAGDPDECVLRLPRDVLAQDSVALLEPLTDRDVTRFVKLALPELLAPEALAIETVRRTQGHPAATRALLSRFAAGGGFVRSGGAWLADLDRLHAVAFDVAGGLGHEVATSRLDGPTRDLLSVVAAAGCPLSVTDAAVALGVEVATLLSPALELAARRLVRHDGGAPPVLALRFPHDRASLLRGRPIEPDIGRRTVVRIARSPRSTTRVRAAAQLASELGDPRAYALWRKAGKLAIDARRPAAALDAAQRMEELDRARAERDPWWPRLLGLAHAALGAVGEADAALRIAAERTRGQDALALVLERAQVLERAARPVDALAVVDAGLARTDLGDVRALRALRAWLVLGRGEKSEARAQVDALLDESRPLERSAPMLEVFATAMAVSWRLADARRARAAAVSARRIARSLGRLGRVAHFDSTLGVWDLEGARTALGRRRVRRALELLERVDDRRLLPDTLMRYGWMRFAAGEARSALEAFRRAEILFERVGNRRGLGWAHNGIGTVLLMLGDPERAATAFDRSVVEREAVGASSGAGLSAVNLYRAHVARLDLEAARRAAHKALQHGRGPARTDVRAVFLLAVGQTAARERDVRRVRVLAKRALAAAQAAGLDEEAARAAGLVAESALQAGDPSAAMLAMRTLHRSARRRGHAGDRAFAVVLRAGLLLLRGRAGEARRLFERAGAAVLEPGPALDVKLLHARLALLAFTRGDGSEARGGRVAAQDAERLARRLSDRHAEESARRLVAALVAAEESATPGADVLRQNRKLKQVLEATRWINEATAVRDVLSRIIDAAIELAGARRGFVVVRESAATPLAFVAARSLRREDILDPALQVSRSIVEDVLATGCTIVTSEARVDERFRSVRSISELALLSVACAPLKSRGSVVGAIYVDDPTRVDRFDDHAREHLEALAEHAAIALDKARLLNHIEELRRDLERDVAARSEELEEVRSDLERVRLDLDARYSTRQCVTNDRRMLEVLELVQRIADSDASVLIQGEPGTGKELVARALHHSSFRRRRRFVAVNCAGLPDGLVEAELFGYKRGAFSGAVADHDGLIAAADGGTLFLDEIGEMPLAVQAKVLRVAQDGEYLPLGAAKPKRAKLRIVSATNRPLADMVAQGRFRQDLFYRLRVIQIDVPPLRERRGDIPLLARTFAARAAAESGHAPKLFTDAAIAALTSAHWRGNVRELEGLVNAVVAVSASGVVDVGDLVGCGFRGDGDAGDERGARAAADAPPDRGGRGAAARDGAPSLKAALEARERELVVAALERARGQRSVAAAELGITTRWLAKLIQKYGLRVD